MTTAPRLPAIFISHGGGPWPFVEMPIVAADVLKPLEAALRSLVTSLPMRPSALLVVSAHWEEPVATLMTSPHPPMLFDYTGYPPAAYELSWPAPGAPHLAARVEALLGAAGFTTATNPTRGYDHGTFIPLMLAVPGADIPILQLSLIDSLDPAQHIAMGRALAPLRDEGILLVGSGNSYHNMRGFGHRESTEPSRQFDEWLADAVVQLPAERERRLCAWSEAPGAKHCHPREEHLLPLHVMMGAGLEDEASFPLRMFALETHHRSVRFG